MESLQFQQRKKEALQFENTCNHLLKKLGFKVYPNTATDYQGKATHDTDAYWKGSRYRLDMKCDFASASTGRYCIEKDSLDHTEAQVFLIGRPVVHWVPVRELRNLYDQLRHTEMNVGEFSGPSVFIDVSELESKPYVKKLTKN